jgi:myo-inositol-1(or 4)-monophosphatase
LPGANIPPDLKPDADLLKAAVRGAGALALSLLNKNVRNWSKPDGSVVTEVDISVNDYLFEHLQKARPTYGWLSEETPPDEHRLTCERVWIVDPIDGTRSFVNGTDGWCIGVALVENGRPIITALFRPMVDEFFFAAKGAGAWCNDVALAPRDGETLLHADLLGTGRAVKLFAPDVKGHDTPHIPLLLRLAYVAAGRADIALSIGPKNDWDLAAGDLLMQESGATLTTTDGTLMIYNKRETWQNGMVAAGPLRHKAVMKKLETL